MIDTIFGKVASEEELLFRFLRNLACLRDGDQTLEHLYNMVREESVEQSFGQLPLHLRDIISSVAMDHHRRFIPPFKEVLEKCVVKKDDGTFVRDFSNYWKIIDKYDTQAKTEPAPLPK